MGILGLNMPVILAAFANSEFATGVGGYSLFNSLTAVGALSGALLSARRVEVVRLRTLVGLLAGFGGVLAVASAGAECLPLRCSSGRLRAVDAAVPHRRQQARPAFLRPHPSRPSHECLRTRPPRWTGHRWAGRGLVDRPVRCQVKHALLRQPDRPARDGRRSCHGPSIPSPGRNRPASTAAPLTGAHRPLLRTMAFRPNRNGRLSSSSTLKSALHDASTARGGGKSDPHDLRHGGDPGAAGRRASEAVHERLGHRNISNTLDTYSHLTAGLHDERGRKGRRAVHRFATR